MDLVRQQQMGAQRPAPGGLAGRVGGMFGGGAPTQSRPQLTAARAAAPMAGGQRMAPAAPQRAPIQRTAPGGLAGRVGGMFGSGGAPGGMAGRVGGMAGVPARAPTGGPGMAGMVGGLMSDERSKQKIAELEGIKRRYEALIDSPTEKPRGFEDVGSYEYEYKDPSEPGAAPGRHVGPMAHELRSLPGVVERGPDGFDRVNADRLSLANASATGELSREKADRAEVEALRARLAALSDDPDASLRAGLGR